MTIDIFLERLEKYVGTSERKRQKINQLSNAWCLNWVKFLGCSPKTYQCRVETVFSSYDKKY